MLCKNCNREIGLAAICPNCGARLLKKPLPHHLPEGTLIGGKYRIVGVLDEGGFGITYLGNYEKLGLAVAIKEYYPQGVTYRDTTDSRTAYTGSDDEAFFERGKERFLEEAQVLVRFNNEPGVVSVIDFVEENNTAYLVMEYLDGETLKEYLDEHGTMSAEEAFGMLEPMMRTLEMIHAEGVIHRDISADNIMRLKNGQLKLMDFGAAREFDNNGGRSMSVLLKMGYAPEEQYRRNGEQGPWTDVYAMCAAIYRCITGKTPIDSLDRLTSDTLEKPSELGVKISPALENVLMYGLAVYKKDRCQSMTELLGLLKKAKTSTALPKKPSPAEKPVEPKPAAMLPAKESPLKAPETTKKKSPLAAVISIILVVALAITAIVIWKNQSTGNTANKSTSSKDDEQKETESSESTEDNRWTDIVAIAAGSQHTVGVKEDGSVVAVGSNFHGEREVDDWTDIVAVAAGGCHTVGLKRDGTVIATGINDHGECNVDGWTDIIAVSSGTFHTVGLKKDGTVVAIGNNSLGQCEVGSWKDIVAISCGFSHTVGLKKDGTVVAVGDNMFGECDVSDWTDITAISAFEEHTVGLKADGTVTAIGYNDNGETEVAKWTDIVAVASGGYHTVGLKRDGTVVAVGDSSDGSCSVDSWTDIVAVSAGSWHTVGLKSDGTVVAAGTNGNGQCNVTD